MILELQPCHLIAQVRVELTIIGYFEYPWSASCLLCRHFLSQMKTTDSMIGQNQNANHRPAWSVARHDIASMRITSVPIRQYRNPQIKQRSKSESSIIAAPFFRE